MQSQYRGTFGSQAGDTATRLCARGGVDVCAGDRSIEAHRRHWLVVWGDPTSKRQLLAAAHVQLQGCVRLG